MLLAHVRAYQRLATSFVIAIPRFDWASLNEPPRIQGWFVHILAGCCR